MAIILVINLGPIQELDKAWAANVENCAVPDKVLASLVHDHNQNWGRIHQIRVASAAGRDKRTQRNREQQQHCSCTYLKHLEKSAIEEPLKD
jgi:hypothetical protein